MEYTRQYNVDKQTAPCVFRSKQNFFAFSVFFAFPLLSFIFIYFSDSITQRFVSNPPPHFTSFLSLPLVFSDTHIRIYVLSISLGPRDIHLIPGNVLFCSSYFPLLGLASIDAIWVRFCSS